MILNMASIVAVGTGGFIGANLRYYTGLKIAHLFPHTIPLATLCVNLVGSLMIGLLIGLFTVFTPTDNIKLFLVTGFLGALTTFSTFSIESFMLLQSHFWYGILNITLNVVGSIAFAAIGYKIIVKLLFVQTV
jgi:CrcB protein